MRFLKPELIDRIESAKDSIDTGRLNLFAQELFQNITKQTAEFAATTDEDNKQRSKEVVENYLNAWYYASEKQDGRYSRALMTDIAGLLEPSQRSPLQTYAEFRETEAYGWKDVKYCPPAGKDRVMAHIDRMERVLLSGPLHPIEEGAFTFFHIARIQPFEMANKRTANIMMNSLFNFYGFAPIIFTDQQEYRKALARAAKGFRIDGSETSDPMYPYLNPGREQSEFMNYLARLELRQLLVAEDLLCGLNIYDIEMDSKDPGNYYIAKRKIDSWFRSNPKENKIQLLGKQGKLKVIGNIPERTLKRILDEIPGIRRYNIEGDGFY
jgi:hypothetical protein